MDIITAKILRKKVDDRTYNGATKISFMVSSRGEEKWLSAFVDEKKMPPEVVQLFRELGEGDKCEISYEAKESGGKTFYNIKSLQRVTDIRDEVSPPTAQAQAPAQPVRQEGDTKVRSMALAYSKDIEISESENGPEPAIGEWRKWATERIISRAKRFEQYILTGE